MPKDHLVIKIADIVFAIFFDQTSEMIRLENSLHDFLVADEPDIIIHTYNDGLPDITLTDKKKVFDSETVWSFYQIEGKNVFVLKSDALGQSPYRIAVFDSDFRQGKVFSHHPKFKKSTKGDLLNPLEYPLPEVLMICLLAQGYGLMVHACGIEDNGKGYLFAGNSTHGKSTMAKLWKDQSIVLNDDRIVLRNKNGLFWMYGTPWHGEYTGVSPQGVLLDKIFFIHHDEVNSVNRVNGAGAISMLLARCFPPIWDEKGMAFTLDFCGQLVNKFPCYELNFMLDRSIVDFVRCVK